MNVVWVKHLPGKKNGSKRFVFLVLFWTIILASIFIANQRRGGQISTNDTGSSINKQPSSQYSDGKNNDLQLDEIEQIGELKSGTFKKISWNYDKTIGLWGNEVTICLAAFDVNNQIISATAEWNEPKCTLKDGSTDGTYLIGKARLDDKVYLWQVPRDLPQRYFKIPEYYKLRLLVLDELPPEGQTEWAGTLGSDESTETLYFYK